MKSILSNYLSMLAAGAVMLTFCTISIAAEPVRIGYSDWPGWVAWEVAIEKQWFKEAGVEVNFA
jgi:NitT/TauT family transport system substrate-binding protein